MNQCLDRPRVTVLVCTLNEAESLPHFLPLIPEDWADEILVVDGGSTDGTMEIVSRLLPHARVLVQPGKGKGDALKYGVREATGEVVVTLDADGETDPQRIPQFIETLLEGYDFVKGSRLSNGRPKRMPYHRWFGNKILAMTFNLLYRTRLTDVCSGYNAFWKKSFLSLDLPYDNFEMEQQLFARARKAGMRMIESPYLSEGRIAGASKTKDLKQGLVDWLVIVRERFTRQA